MTLRVTQSLTAIGPGRSVSFGAVAGTEPYSFAVRPGGAGGTIDAATGLYTAPAAPSSDPGRTSDVIVVTDAAAAVATGRVLVALPLLLFCEILERELGLSGRVVLWNQKLPQPSDNGLFIAVQVPTARPFGATTRPRPTTDGLDQEASVNMVATVDMDLISRGPEARDRKEEVVLALGGFYAQQQQEANGFSIARLPSRFLNLSEIDGAAIPYRFRISVVLQYAFTKSKDVPFFSSFDAHVAADDGAAADLASLVSGEDANGPTDNIIDGGDANTQLAEA